VGNSVPTLELHPSTSKRLQATVGLGAICIFSLYWAIAGGPGWSYASHFLAFVLALLVGALLVGVLTATIYVTDTHVGYRQFGILRREHPRKAVGRIARSRIGGDLRILGLDGRPLISTVWLWAGAEVGVLADTLDVPFSTET
jgi:hypothetical protein